MKWSGARLSDLSYERLCLGAKLMTRHHPPPPVLVHPQTYAAMATRLLLMWLLGATVLSGCGAAQQALSAQATVHEANRLDRWTFYADESARCQGQEPTYDTWFTCMAPARHVQRAADSYRSTLEAAQAGIDAGNGDALIPCVIAAAASLVEAAAAAGAPLPSDVQAIADLVPEGICNGR